MNKMYDLVIRNVRILFSSKTCDIGVKNGVIDKIGHITLPTKQVIEGGGKTILPPYVESHIHLDTALTNGKPIINQTGELFEGITIWNKYRNEFLTYEDVVSRATEVIEEMACRGVLFMRAMVDVSDQELVALKALLDVKSAVSSYMELQLVAFPQNGISSVEGDSLLRRAISLGVDGISAVPHLEPTREKGVESLKTCFNIAMETGVFLHIFCDEVDDGQSRFLETVASLAIDKGLFEKVTVSHINAMSYYSEAYVRKLLGLLQSSRLNVVTCPLISTAMQGRFDSWPKGRGITRVKDLLQAGINVAVAHDDMMSPFYPLGTGSMLSAGHMLMHVAHMTGAEDFDTVYEMLSFNPAKILKIPNYDVREGNPANFIMVAASSTHDLLRRQCDAELVVSKGRIIAETTPAIRSFHHH